MIIRKANTALSLVLNRNRWPFLMRRIREILGRPHPDWNQTNKEATKKCERAAVTPKFAFEQLAPGAAWIDFSKQHFAMLAAARKQVANAKKVGSLMGGGMEMDMLYNLVLHKKPQRVIETGVAYGWSSLALLTGLRASGGGRLWSTNLAYAGMDCESDVGCAVSVDLRSDWTIARGADSVVLPQVCAEVIKCQMIVYDSDKLYAGRRASYKLLWNILEPGGYFVSDDISDNLGFFHFAKTADEKPIIVRHVEETGAVKYVGIIVKGGERPLRDILF